MGDLSRNFSRHEFLCPCCKKGNPNPLLVQTLQKLRDLALVPVKVNSGYRCPKHNKAVGGARNSRHMENLAADIEIEGWDQDRTMAALEYLVREDMAYVGYAYKIGKSDRAVHVDVRIPESGTVRKWRLKGM